MRFHRGEALNKCLHVEANYFQVLLLNLLLSSYFHENS